MLGTSFFHEMTGQGKKVMKNKVYDQVNVTLDSADSIGENDEPTHLAGHEEWNEDDFTEALALEGDDDAIMILDFESAAAEVIQNDEELASAYSSYVEARKKLGEKFRARGFWPISAGKGKGKNVKGKFKTKVSWGRKTLQQRIMESNCRICGRKGHWKSECPQRSQSSTTNAAAAPVTLSLGTDQQVDEVMPMEFLLLPEMPNPNNQDSRHSKGFSFVQTVFSNAATSQHALNTNHGDKVTRDRIRAYILGNKGNNSRVASLVSRIESKLKKPVPPNHFSLREPAYPSNASEAQSKVVGPCRASENPNSTEVPSRDRGMRQVANSAPQEQVADAMFSTHDTWGIIDTGATKTVIGSEHVGQFLQSLDAKVRDQVKRCACEVTFRFGNQGTLKSKHALVVPVCGLGLKIAIVPGTTPFLLSNTLFRALEAMIDTANHQIILPKHDVTIPLQLTSKGLYLIDINKLTQVVPKDGESFRFAETFAHDSEKMHVKTEMPATHEDMTCMKAEGNMSKVNHEESLKCEPKAVPVSPASFSPPCHSFKHQSKTSEASRQSQSSSPTDLSCESPVTHERFVLRTTPACPSQHVARSSPTRSASGVTGGAQAREDDVWKDACGSHLRGNLDGIPGVDSLVLPALSSEQQSSSPTCDSVHRKEGGGNGRLGSPADNDTKLPGTSGSEKLCSTQGDAIAGQSQSGSLAIDEHQSTCHGRARKPMASIRRFHDDPWTSTTCAEHGECAPTAVEPHCTSSGSINATIDGRQPSNSVSVGLGRGGDPDCMGSMNSECNLVQRAGEIDEFCESIPNHERQKFWRLVNQYEKELSELFQVHKPMGRAIDLLEVFCSENSNLTNQVNQLQGRAMRFGLNQGDLQSSEGRKALMIMVCRHCPRHIWLSPKCGPWSNWSKFNSGRSLQLWDRIHAERLEMLSQVALCLVLCRHQVRMSRHVHWEQPKGSLMLKLPYLQELSRYTKCANPDMCKAGDLKDPNNMKFMKKGLNIMTTSPSMYQALDPLRCDRTHDHQLIEGSTIAHGQTVARSAFSELYPRKFARLVAKIILKSMFPTEKPVGTVHDPVLSIVDQILAHDDRLAKRPKLGTLRSPKSKTADRSLDQGGENKRRRIAMPPSPIEIKPSQTEIHNKTLNIIQVIESKLPRVGKKVFDDEETIKMVQEVFPEKTVKIVVACKGTERTMGPPKQLHAREAPFRRAIMKARADHRILMDPIWERHDTLAQRQIIRKSHPCRVNITVFAADVISTEVPVGAKEVPSVAASPESAPSMPPAAVASVPPDHSPAEPTEVDTTNRIPELTEDKSGGEKAGLVDPGQPVDDMPESAEMPINGQHGPRFLALPREEQVMLKRAHQNLCHPSHDKLSAVLKAQGARPELSQAVFDMSCQTCAAAQKPKIARPSTIKHELDFNDKIFIDGITWTNKNGKSFHFYHVLDQATNFHVAAPAPSRAAEDAIRCLTEIWLQWAGPPNSLVTDSATEFTSEQFAGFLQRHDIQATTTAPYAHWQNGRCERHGQILQSMLDKIDREFPINSYDDLQ